MITPEEFAAGFSQAMGNTKSEPASQPASPAQRPSPPRYLAYDMDEAQIERRARAMARRRGYRVIKDRRRPLNAADPIGPFSIVDSRNRIVAEGLFIEELEQHVYSECRG